MHIINITPNLLFEYQCTSGKFIRLPNRIESKKIDSVARIESNRNFFCPNWNALAESNGSLPPGLWLVTCRLNRDQLRKPRLGSRVWATFYLFLQRASALHNQRGIAPGRRDYMHTADDSSIQNSRRIYVRPRTGPQSAQLWWPAVAKLQAASVPTA